MDGWDGCMEWMAGLLRQEGMGQDKSDGWMEIIEFMYGQIEWKARRDAWMG